MLSSGRLKQPTEIGPFTYQGAGEIRNFVEGMRTILNAKWALCGALSLALAPWTAGRLSRCRSTILD